MNGFNVLHPMGWDAFGLPAEETAIKNKEYPAETVDRNIHKFKQQLLMLGLGYDWSREINTTNPTYYSHTQRIFLEFFKKGLAYNDTVSVNWCPALNTVLANEDIVNGKSERGDHPVFQRPMRQWILKITQYADRLIDDLELLPQWPEKVKTAQKNWIARTEGYEFTLQTTAGVDIPVFTNKIEYLPRMNFVVLAPENSQVENLLKFAKNSDLIKQYVEKSTQYSGLDRKASKLKTGLIVEGISAINNYSGKHMPIVIADYVLASDGSGAIMGVPSNDENAANLAKELAIQVTDGTLETGKDISESGLSTEELSKTHAEIAVMVGACPRIYYGIRDWVFSRQRFWGEPFPIVWIEGEENYNRLLQGPVAKWIPEKPIFHKEGDKTVFAVPVIPEYLKAVELPRVDFYEPTGTMEGPLATMPEWVDTFINPSTGEVKNVADSASWIPAKRETNTMPQWAGSSWYWLRYMDPDNKFEPFSKEAAKKWGPVNVYAGADHAVAHLIYARFWHKVMQDVGMVDFPEPFERLEFLGYILAADGSKISKRSGNSRSPEDVIEEVGADAFRLYEMFIGPFEKAAPWRDSGLIGTRRFVEKVWNLGLRVLTDSKATTDTHVSLIINKTIQKVGTDIEAFKFNTAVASLMSCSNEMMRGKITAEDFMKFLLILAPFAPHITEEIWSMFGNKESIHMSSWPKATEQRGNSDTFTLIVKINGKNRATMLASRDLSEAEIYSQALREPGIQAFLAGKMPSRFVYVPGRLINIVV